MFMKIICRAVIPYISYGSFTSYCHHIEKQSQTKQSNSNIVKKAVEILPTLFISPGYVSADDAIILSKAAYKLDKLQIGSEIGNKNKWKLIKKSVSSEYWGGAFICGK